jgi:RimJ/RimL family protein N-acetyltransferase
MDRTFASTTAATLLTLRDGQRILLSPAAPDDAAPVADLLLRLSPRTLRLRYLSARSFTAATAWAEAERMVRGRAALIATPVQRAFAEAIAVAELVPDHTNPAIGHLGIVVRDDWQGHGLGSALVRELVAHAPALGIATIQADLLAENDGARRLLAPLDLPRNSATRHGETQILLRLPDAA